MNRRELLQAMRLSTTPSSFCFQLGYAGVEIPRLIRKLFAQSRCHKYWLGAYYGGGICSVLERQHWKPGDDCSDPEPCITPEIAKAGYKAGITAVPATDNPYPLFDCRGELWEHQRSKGLKHTVNESYFSEGG